MADRDRRTADPPLPAGQSLVVPGAWLLVLAVLWAYHNSLGCPFFFDDEKAIIHNLHIRRLWPIWQVLSVPPNDFLAGRPISALSFAINYAIGGLRVTGYHVVNIAIHLLNTLLFWRITAFTLGRTRLAERFGDMAETLALAAALIWTVHPLLVDAVTYLAQRTELLMSCWLLTTLWCLIRSSASASPHGWHAAGIVACALGMGSKQVMIVAPALVWLYDWVFLAANARETLAKRRCFYSGLVACWGLLAALVSITHLSYVVGFRFRELTPWDYLRTQSTVIWRYLHLTVWPHPMLVDYWDWPVARSWSAVLWPLGSLAVLLAASLKLLSRKHALGFVGAWFFFTLGPTSSVMPITSEIAAERRMYLPLLALTAAAVAGGWRLLNRAVADPARRWQIGAAVVGALVLVFGTLTLRWNITHYSVDELWRDTIRKRPGNARAHANLSVEYLHQGRAAEAIAEARVVVRLAPDNPEAHYSLGLVLRQLGWVPEAARSYHEAIRLKPGHAPAHSNLGVLLDEAGRTREAVREYWIAIQLDSVYPDPHNNLGVALEKLGFRRQAIEHYRQAIMLSPGYAMARKNLGEALINEGRIEEGRREIAAALALKPDHPGIQASWKRASALAPGGPSAAP